jgi:hypothetical protein
MPIGRLEWRSPAACSDMGKSDVANNAEVNMFVNLLVHYRWCTAAFTLGAAPHMAVIWFGWPSRQEFETA